jgi:hypothetical protein
MKTNRVVALVPGVSDDMRMPRVAVFVILAFALAINGAIIVWHRPRNRIGWLLCAARTLESFAKQLRDEVDLDALRGDLIGAVERTMAPAHASAWLRSGAEAPVTISGRPMVRNELE